MGVSAGEEGIEEVIGAEFITMHPEEPTAETVAAEVGRCFGVERGRVQVPDGTYNNGHNVNASPAAQVVKHGASYFPKDDALSRQVSGGHYLKFPIQPAVFLDANREHIGWAEGIAIEYICRHSFKDGPKDIDKAIHSLELLRQLRYPDHAREGT